MCNKETYQQFKKLYEEHAKHNHFTRKYNTALGEREVVVKKFFNDNTIYVVYKDYDGSTLFHIEVHTNGRVKIYKTKVDAIAIYSAIYEINTILYKEKQMTMDKTLELLFENNCFNNGFMGIKF